MSRANDVPRFVVQPNDAPGTGDVAPAPRVASGNDLPTAAAFGAASPVFVGLDLKVKLRFSLDRAGESKRGNQKNLEKEEFSNKSINRHGLALFILLSG